MHHFNLNPNLSWVHSLLIASLMLSGSAAMAAPSGLLNDTGQTGCYDHTDAPVTCSLSTTDADASSPNYANARPRQDGRFGRDVASPSKTGSGAAGFDFSKVCMNGDIAGTSAGAVGGNVAGGNSTGNCTASPAQNTGSGPLLTEWACTKDNVTNLVWSLQTVQNDWSGANGATAMQDMMSRCGFSNGWRLPTRRELLSIVHRGLAVDPAIDANFFPSTQSGAYWASDNGVPTVGWSSFVNFVNGDTGMADASTSNYVRFVRSGP